jgi:menaquinol-cytochrome c reductase iron-sulfur subunit
MGATLAFLLGGAVAAPSFARRESEWLPAGNLDDLTDNQPEPVTIRVVREDGYSQVVDRQIVFLVKTGPAQVTALSSTCTHLGCRVRWDSEAKALKCPCHGGVFDRSGTVTGGPPPTPLARFATRIDGDRVLVQL